MHGDLELLGFIVGSAEGDQCIRLAAQAGIKGGTVLLGEGTARSGILRRLGLDTIKREIVLMIAPSQAAKAAMDFIVEKKHLEDKNRGVSFRLPLNRAIGFAIGEPTQAYKGENPEMYQAIFVIVNEGEAERVMDAAQGAGAQGGTVIQAHGAGANETKRVFKMDIEPEKDIVLILSAVSLTDLIVEAVSLEMKLEEPNSGVLFVTDLSETRGVL